MKYLFLFLLFVIDMPIHSQVTISEILAYEYNNEKNTFSPNVVGKESFDFDGSGNHSLIVIRLNRIPGTEYKYMERKLKVVAQYEGEGTVEVYEQKDLIVPFVDPTFYLPLIIQKGSTELTTKAELFEGEKLVSTKKQMLASWSGD